MGLISILQVRKLRLRDIMRLSWGHTVISAEPEGNPDFWHSALSTELIISLLSICGALIHFYHQWVMTQRHCSSVSWSCNAKWAFSNSSEPNGGLRHKCQQGEGCGVQCLSSPAGWEHWEQASPSCSGRQVVPSRAQQHQRVQIMPSSSLAEVNGWYSLYSFCRLTSTGWEEG